MSVCPSVCPTNFGALWGIHEWSDFFSRKGKIPRSILLFIIFLEYVMTLKFSGAVHNVFWKFSWKFEQVLTFDSVFMTLQFQNFSFSKKLYSFSAIFKRMLTTAIFLKKFFHYFYGIIFVEYNIRAFRIYIVLLGYCKHLKSYIILSES